MSLKATAVVDISVETPKSRFRIRRFHHPLFQGYFGKGWCSDIDLSLSLVSEKTILLKACRVAEPVHFTLPDGAGQEVVKEAKATRHPSLSLRKVGEIWILKNQGIAIAQFDLKGKPSAIRSSHNGSSPSSEWLRFHYDDSGRLSEIGFQNTGDLGQRFMANVPAPSAQIIFKENTQLIEEIRTPLSATRYLYKGQHLAQTQVGQTKRSPD